MEVLRPHKQRVQPDTHNHARMHAWVVLATRHAKYMLERFEELWAVENIEIAEKVQRHELEAARSKRTRRDSILVDDDSDDDYIVKRKRQRVSLGGKRGPSAASALARGGGAGGGAGAGGKSAR